MTIDFWLYFMRVEYWIESTLSILLYHIILFGFSDAHHGGWPQLCNLLLFKCYKSLSPSFTVLLRYVLYISHETWSTGWVGVEYPLFTHTVLILYYITTLELRLQFVNRDTRGISPFSWSVNFGSDRTAHSSIIEIYHSYSNRYLSWLRRHM